MKSILVIERKHLFPGLSPQGFLPADTVDLDGLAGRLFFAERRYMEQNSHFKQIIPYMLLQRGTDPEARILCYQRRVKHTESRLGGLWSVGFGGHMEPIDRNGEAATMDVVTATALRELEEETGLTPGAEAMTRRGFINSDREDVSSVHFGVVFSVDISGIPGSDAEVMDLVGAQSEPHQARWIPVADLAGMTRPGAGPEGADFEDWSRIAISGLFG